VPSKVASPSLRTSTAVCQPDGDASVVRLTTE
jgi:hypothetical protein